LHILEDTWVPLNEGVDVPTGLAVAIPEGHYGRIVARSSALRRKKLQLQEGIIDAGYRGPLFSYAYCPLTEWTKIRGGVQLERGESIAQLIVTPVPKVEWEEVQELPESVRGEAGFGSSGR
jgi:dUTP pyrophosphatase